MLSGEHRDCDLPMINWHQRLHRLPLRDPVDHVALGYLPNDPILVLVIEQNSLPGDRCYTNIIIGHSVRIAPATLKFTITSSIIIFFCSKDMSIFPDLRWFHRCHYRVWIFWLVCRVLRIPSRCILHDMIPSLRFRSSIVDRNMGHSSVVWKARSIGLQ